MIFFTQFFFTQNFVAEFFLGSTNFLHPKSFWTQNLFGPKIFLDSKSFWTQNLFGCKIFWPKIFLAPHNFASNFFWQNIFYLKALSYFQLNFEVIQSRKSKWKDENKIGGLTWLPSSRLTVSAWLSPSSILTWLSVNFKVESKSGQ